MSEKLEKFEIELPDYDDAGYKEMVTELTRALAEHGESVFAARPDLVIVCRKALDELAVRRSESATFGAMADVCVAASAEIDAALTKAFDQPELTAMVAGVNESPVAIARHVIERQRAAEDANDLLTVCVMQGAKTVLVSTWAKRASSRGADRELARAIAIITETTD